MDTENCRPADFVGTVDEHLAIKTTGPQQRRIQNFRPIGGSQQHQPLAWIETVHFHQQLIECLLFFVMTSADPLYAPRPPEGVEFVDENDRGRFLPCLLEQVTNPRRAHADEHFHKL